MVNLYHTITSLEFWEGVLNSFQAAGPVAAFLLAMLESFIPALPLTAIAALNVTAHGLAAGFFLTWAGSCTGCTLAFFFFRYVYEKLAGLFHWKSKKLEKARKWIAGFDTAALFLLLCLPFTPSAFMNFAFGVSDFPAKRYLITLLAAKILMIGSLSLFGDSLTSMFSDPIRLMAFLLLMLVLYLLSVYLRKKHGLSD